jgi:AmmeMemoRadiSam system protein B
MKRRFLLCAVVAFAAGCSLAAPPPSIRHAAVAGSFYPADPKELARMVDDFLSRAPAAAVNEPVVALVSPHAGYAYSGAVAAHGYALLKGKKIQRVVVIAPSHVDAFPFAAIYDGEAYETPLGAIPIDRAFCAKLASGSLVRLSSRGHVVSGERGEHSIEVQLPFLQRALGQFQLVPIVMGDQSYEISRALGVALASQLRGTDTLIVASSDLSHFHPYNDAVTLDRKTLRAIQEWDYLSMSQNFESRVWEACGGGPIVAAMIASERLGASQARLLKYANSERGGLRLAGVREVAQTGRRDPAVLAHRGREAGADAAGATLHRDGGARPQAGGLHAGPVRLVRAGAGSVRNAQGEGEAAGLHRVRVAAEAARDHGARRGRVRRGQ